VHLVRPLRGWNAAALAFFAIGCDGAFERPANPTCLAPARPSQLVELRPVYESVALEEPVQMQITSDGAWWYVAQRRGRVVRFAAETDAPQVEVVLDLGPEVFLQEAGLLGFALHPDFTTNGDLFVSYTRTGGTFATSRLSRFHSSDGGRTFDAAGELVVLEIDQTTRLHHNADIEFGPDGYLYLGFGDGGPHGDPNGHAQDPFQLKGKILRIDVDAGSPYTIPSDNPFATGGGAPEVWALGFRNPWRFGFDRLTGELWAGDVGWRDWEELDLVVRGGNYGWPLREGTHCVGDNACETPGLIDPVVEYGHDQGHSITAGTVYRGTAIPDLAGHVIYGDYVTGYVWALDPNERPAAPRVINADGHNVISFAEDLDGELYLLDIWRGTIWRLAAGATGPADLPGLLSSTGCFGPGGEPASGLIPYEINVPFWSDGADKRRWMALPDGATIGVTGDGDLDFPIGSVLVKEFGLGGLRVETRLMVRHDDGAWAGYTYRWDADQDDATLLPLASEPTIDEWGGATWSYPRRPECLACHTAAAGRTLGLELRQLDRPGPWPDRPENQLEAFERAGLFDRPLPATRTPLPEISGTAPLAERARAWLHANCSYCHRPGGVGEGGFDLRFDTPLAETAVCDVPPEDDLGLTDARIVAPGAPERSVLATRIRSTGVSRMPPLGSAVIDEAGAALVEAWIRSITSCE
jgi:uncharacterized repeat protein (TIGR03806 family)